VSEDLTEAFHRSVEEGTERLRRSWPQLLATGVVGGIDVSIGVFAMFVVQERTGNELLGAAAFTLGFVALTLANSELFTENFLVPVAAVVAKDAPWWSLPRLWVGTTVTNFVGGWVAMALVVAGFPELKAVALEVGSHPPSLGIGTVAFSSAILAGGAITLMTWMERSTESVPAKLISAIGIAFLLAAAPLQHAIVISIEMFAALRTGAAPFGYLDWLGTMGWAVLGNLIGGLGLVTALRLVQVGAKEIEQEQQEER
jgi:formate/nitrite transporter FocA (FNT family)